MGNLLHEALKAPVPSLFIQNARVCGEGRGGGRVNQHPSVHREGWMISDKETGSVGFQFPS